MQSTQRTGPTLPRRANPTVVFLGTLALMLAGLFVPGVLGGVLLLLLAAGLVVLLRATWPALAPAARMLRALVVVLLIVAAFAKIG